VSLEHAAFARIRAAYDAGEKLSQDEFGLLCSRAGRTRGPELLWEAWMYGVISPAVLTAAAGPVWSAAEYPEGTLGRQSWLELFTDAGFTIDGTAADRPAGPVTLWRGSVHARRRGMSWTSDREIAQNFADGELPGRQPGQLWQVTAPPAAILCVDNGRQEAEHVLDTRGLAIRETASGTAGPREASAAPPGGSSRTGSAPRGKSRTATRPGAGRTFSAHPGAQA
jgi:hypothetical protein